MSAADINNTSSDEPTHHDEADEFTSSPAADNPVSDSFNIVVSIPESIKIRMVDASALADYEVWIFIVSLTSNFMVGFLVSYFQAIDTNSPSRTYIGWTAFFFIALFVVTGATALRKRASIQSKGKDVKLKTSSASTRQ